jgi:hypothetical protein
MLTIRAEVEKALSEDAVLPLFLTFHALSLKLE